MSEVVFANEKLISTSRASKLSGYSQDYLAQLCRSGALQCKMISDQWFIDPLSLKKYVPDMEVDTISHSHEVEHEHGGKKQADHKHSKAQKKAYSVKVADVRSGAFKYDGADYVPTQRAAEISGYTQDYIGQLARAGEIPARKVGRRWYIARKALEEHREAKDALLQAVQSDASGITKASSNDESCTEVEVPIRTNFDIKYFSDTGAPLMPRGTTEIHHPEESLLVTNTKESTTTDASLGRFGAINTNLGYTREEESPTVNKAKSSPLIAPPIPKQSNFSANTVEIDQKREKTTTATKILLISLIITFLLTSTLFTLIYFGVVQKSLLEPLRPIYNIIQSLEYSYGEYAPGKTIKYSN